MVTWMWWVLACSPKAPTDSGAWTGTTGGVSTTGMEETADTADTPRVELPPATWSGDIEPMLLDACVPCHVGQATGGLAVDQGTAALVGVPSFEAPDVALIAPGEPGASYLYLKCTDQQDTVGGSGAVMPPGSQQLTDEQLALLASWILAGALPD
jgi:hypothetical protein